MMPHPCRAAGSSPRMRGAHTDPYNGHNAGGIIPAHAGSTKKAAEELLPAGDHPRACGEHSN